LRLKATQRQRVVMLGFMIGICLWVAWPDPRLSILVGMAGAATALWLLPARRK
jgi:hypothetical protein